MNKIQTNSRNRNDSALLICNNKDIYSVTLITALHPILSSSNYATGFTIPNLNIDDIGEVHKISDNHGIATLHIQKKYKLSKLAFFKIYSHRDEPIRCINVRNSLLHFSTNSNTYI